jgi:outer membrane protein
MTGKLCRSIVAVALVGLMALAPVSNALGQTQAPAPAATPGPAPSGNQQNPAPTTPEPKDISATPTPTPPGIPLTVSVGPDFTHSKPFFPRIWAPYTGISLAEQQYVNAPQIEQLVRDGKLSISMHDAIELALQNNPDITVQRYYSWMAETDILRAKGGGTQRGVNIVGTPVAFADVPTLSFDPLLTSSISLDQRTTPVNNPLTSGTGTSTGGTTASLGTHTAIANAQYSQNFHTGTSVTIFLDNTRTSTTSPAVLFNPSVQSVGEISVVQPLLNGFGRFINERYINVAIITKKVVDYAFEQSLITDITAVENDYWELVFARGNVDVQVHAVDLAQRLYDDNKRQVEVGTLAPIEIVRAEAQLATAQQSLILAQTAQRQQQSLLMSVIARNPISPLLRDAEIIPTDMVQAPPIIENIALPDAVDEAVAKRPDVLEAKVNITADDINVRASKNGLLPTLNLSGYVASTGLGGNSRTTTTTTTSVVGPQTSPADVSSQIVGPNNQPLMVLNQNGLLVPIFVPTTRSTVTGTTIIPGGLNSSYNSLFTGKFPEFEAQLSLSIPIRNRVAQADNARALLAERQDQARLQQVISSVAVDVQTAQITLQQDRTAVVAAQKTRALQEQTLDAEQKRLQLGASTIFLVVTDQQALSAAAAAEVRAQVNLVEALVNFERAMGRTLEAHQISIANAKTGLSPRDTLIPGTAANGEIIRANQSVQMLPNSAK